MNRQIKHSKEINILVRMVEESGFKRRPARRGNEIWFEMGKLRVGISYVSTYNYTLSRTDTGKIDSFHKSSYKEFFEELHHKLNNIKEVSGK